MLLRHPSANILVTTKNTLSITERVFALEICPRVIMMPSWGHSPNLSVSPFSWSVRRFLDEHRVIYYSTSGKNSQQGYERVEFDALLEQSDIVSVHAPLDKNTRGLMNREAFREMKSSAVFLNLGRGPIVVEQDLADALEAGEIAGAGLDVLSAEPMRKDNPLRKIKDSEKLIITPHIGWASVEARTRLMEIICQQIADFQNQIIL